MTSKCYFVESPELSSFELEGKTYHYIDTSKLRVGALWHPRDDDGELIKLESARDRITHLSDYYWKHNSKRLPLYVALPKMYTTGAGIQIFCVDGTCFDEKKGYHGGWEVSGDPPTITVKPSINIVNSYHGYIQNGVVTPDCDGRTYPGL